MSYKNILKSNRQRPYDNEDLFEINYFFILYVRALYTIMFEGPLYLSGNLQLAYNASKLGKWFVSGYYEYGKYKVIISMFIRSIIFSKRL